MALDETLPRKRIQAMIVFNYIYEVLSGLVVSKFGI